MTISKDEKKIELVEKLLNEKHICFKEALSLLEVETKIEYISYPYYPYVNAPSVFNTNQFEQPLFTYTQSDNNTYSFNN